MIQLRDYPAFSQAYREYSFYIPSPFPPKAYYKNVDWLNIFSCTGTVTKTNSLKAYNWIYPLPLSYSLYSCENAENNGFT